MPSSAPLFPWLQERSAGILLHPTSLPSSFGIGNLGGNAHRFVNFLADAHARHWQMCPLGPTGYGDSPYQCFSAFAGNPYLVDIAPLIERGLLHEEDVSALRWLPHERVDYGKLYESFWPAMRTAYGRFKQATRTFEDYGDFEQFKAQQRSWLRPYAMFMGLKRQFGGKSWTEWPAEFRSHRAVIGRTLPGDAEDEAAMHEFFQFLFFSQWKKLREHAARKGVSIIGDIPIFTALDSADVWSHPDIFQLDLRTGLPTHVAGVPPDYFSPLGQLWGNPLYEWDALSAQHFEWWIERFRANFALYDIIRLDHFRGFDSYWSIPAGAPDARKGEWKPGPGLAFFNTLKEKLPNARIIAEDLGLITESVANLREATGLPGMAILQFAFGSGTENPYLPHNLKSNCVVYPGTHDNDTSVGWYRSVGPKLQDEFRRYLRSTGEAPHWDLIHAAFKSVCRLAIVPMQDVIGLGSEARFNTPGQPAGNWQWRMPDAMFDHACASLAGELRDISDNSGRQAPRPAFNQRAETTRRQG